MKTVFSFIASLALVPTSHALTDDQQFLAQLRDQSARLLEQSLLPDGIKPPEMSAKDQAWIDNLFAKQRQAQQQTIDT
ncbi:hypothetical protein ACNQ0S_24655, partial [Enterobacter cloacae complex sp.6700816]